jgi:O-acetyl-ADP-ribose deacetylase (regulator of RNase III)
LSLLNIIAVPTSNGTKTIEIHNADITSLDFEFDILVLSAFTDCYIPVPGSVVASLEKNTGVVLETHAQRPLLNFKNSLNCWVSKSFEDLSFKHIICVEGMATSLIHDNSEHVLTNLFGSLSLLNYKGIPSSSIAMPILGAGLQEHSIDLILPKLIEHSILSLNSNPKLQTIFFVELNENKAQLIDKAVNAYLNRTEEKLELVFDDELISVKMDAILSKLVQIRDENTRVKEQNILNELISKIRDKNIRFFEFGILGRKLLEFLLSDISNIHKEGYVSVFEYINELKSRKVADWMITYLHTLRVFGNFLAHNTAPNTVPNKMNKSDIVVFTFALDRFLDFYIEFIREK